MIEVKIVVENTEALKEELRNLLEAAEPTPEKPAVSKARKPKPAEAEAPTPEPAPEVSDKPEPTPEPESKEEAVPEPAAQPLKEDQKITLRKKVKDFCVKKAENKQVLKAWLEGKGLTKVTEVDQMILPELEGLLNG